MKVVVDIKEGERKLTNITEEDELHIWTDVLKDGNIEYSTRILINPEMGTKSYRVNIKNFLTGEEFNQLLAEARLRAIKLNELKESHS